MISYQNSSKLKTAAKDMLTGKYGTAILIIILAQMINFFASELTAMFISVTSVVGMAVYLCLSFAVSVITGVLNVGISCFFLKIACGQTYSVNDLFIGYREQPNKAILISLAFTAVNFVCMTPQQVLFQLYRQTGSLPYCIAALFCLGAGLLIYVPVNLAISQSFYLMLDFPEYGAKETLRASIRIMKGHKARLFYLEASFIPLFILGIFTFFIGFLWLIPYMQMTLTLFFLDIMNPSQQKE